MIKSFEEVSLVEYLKTGNTGGVGYDFHSDTLSNLIYDAVEKILPDSTDEKESMVLFRTDQRTLDEHENLEKFFIETVSALFAKKGVNIKEGSMFVVHDVYTIRPFIVFHVYWYNTKDVPLYTLPQK